MLVEKLVDDEAVEPEAETEAILCRVKVSGVDQCKTRDRISKNISHIIYHISYITCHISHIESKLGSKVWRTILIYSAAGQEPKKEPVLSVLPVKLGTHS